MQALANPELHEHISHMIVEYASATQKTAGIWFQTEADEWWDRTLGHYWFSNRILIPLIISGGIGMTYALMLIFFLAYNGYWCLNWDANLGNSRNSFCRQPQPNTFTA